jgi:hypothetical protein
MLREDWVLQLSNPIPGWSGAAIPFDFGSVYEPHPDI